MGGRTLAKRPQFRKTLVKSASFVKLVFLALFFGTKMTFFSKKNIYNHLDEELLRKYKHDVEFKKSQSLGRTP